MGVIGVTSLSFRVVELLAEIFVMNGYPPHTRRRDVDMRAGLDNTHTARDKTKQDLPARWRKVRICVLSSQTCLCSVVVGASLVVTMPVAISRAREKVRHTTQYALHPYGRGAVSVTIR
jgi:hypothetical protein